MGLFKRDVEATKSAIQQAREPGTRSDAITGAIQRILGIGLDGRGPYKGAAAVAEAALINHQGDPERAISALARGGIVTAAGAGFVTGLGGFVTMPVAIPANVLEFYITATRTVGAIAKLRGYDVTDPAVRTAVLLTLVGAKSTDILNLAGVTLGTGALGGLAQRGLPSAAVMVINKAVGFRLLKKLGEQWLERFGRGVPVIGGAVGATVDGVLLSRIAQEARTQFPPVVAPVVRDWGVR